MRKLYCKQANNIRSNQNVFLLVGLIFFSVFFLSGCVNKNSSVKNESSLNSGPTAIPTKSVEENVKEGPFVSMIPTSDGHWITLEIKNLPKGAFGIEYDLIYFSDLGESKIEKGISTGGKPVELNGATEYIKKVLFGSASCTTGTCKYKYDENVNEGSLTLKVIDQNSSKYETVFRIQKGNEAKSDGLTTGDGIFTLTSSTLSAKELYLTVSTIGIPLKLPNGLAAKSAPYGIFPYPTGKVEVSFKTAEEGDIYAYDGKAWTKLQTKAEDGLIKASATGYFLFILAK